MKAECINCKNMNCYIKQYCSNHWLQIIDFKKEETFYKSGESIFIEGVSEPGLHFIHEGKVKMTTRGLKGKQQIIRFAGNGDVLGHYCAGDEPFPIEIVAMEDSNICFIDNNILEDVLMDTPLLTIALMRYYSGELRKMESRIKQIVQMNTREKVAEALLFIIDSWGLNDSKTITLQVSRRDIADIIGITAEQVVRQLSDFEKEKMIAKIGRKISITNKRGLKNILRNYN